METYVWGDCWNQILIYRPEPRLISLKIPIIYPPKFLINPLFYSSAFKICRNSSAPGVPEPSFLLVPGLCPGEKELLIRNF
jgi:hypothetical protein